MATRRPPSYTALQLAEWFANWARSPRGTKRWIAGSRTCLIAPGAILSAREDVQALVHDATNATG